MGRQSHLKQHLKRLNASKPTATGRLKQIRRYARRSFRYMDAYQKGLNVKQANYAVKKYKRHRVISQNILDKL
jgi:hypothetical protein